MNKTVKYLSLFACALAASLFLSGCGGGADAQSAAPSVTISATESGSKVLFTFVFSEDVGTTFTADDVTVVGGAKASSVTRIDATNYTLEVTPDSGATSVNATVAPGKFSAVARNVNALASSAALPVSAAPVPPTRAAGDVISIYSDSYTPADAAVVMFPWWWQNTTMSDLVFAGNNVKKYSTLNYQGIEFTSQDVSGMSKLHIDIWTPDLEALKVTIISTGLENAVTLNTKKNSWNSFDIDLALYTVPDKKAIIQMKLDSTTGKGTVYVDNIYFYKDASSGASCAAGKTCIDFSASNIGFASFNMNGGGTVAIANDPADASNKVMKFIKKAGDWEWTGTPIYTDLANTVLSKGVAITESDKTITLRVRSTAAVGEQILVKLDGTGGATEIRGTTTKQNGWETMSFVMPANGNYTSLTIFNEPGKTVDTDTTIYIDDIQYPTGASAVIKSCPTAFADGKFATGYSGANIAAGKSIECGSIGNYYGGVTAKDYGSGVAGNAGDPNFNFGWGFLPSSMTADSYFGAYVKAPNNGTANVTGFSKINITAWTWDDMTTKGVTGTVVLKGPAINGCIPTASKTIPVKVPLGAQTYSLPLSAFSLGEACGLANPSAFLAGGVTEVHVQFIGSANMFTTPNGEGLAPNGMILSKIIFGN